MVGLILFLVVPFNTIVECTHMVDPTPMVAFCSGNHAFFGPLLLEEEMGGDEGRRIAWSWPPMGGKWKVGAWGKGTESIETERNQFYIRPSLFLIQ